MSRVRYDSAPPFDIIFNLPALPVPAPAPAPAPARPPAASAVRPFAHRLVVATRWLRVCCTSPPTRLSGTVQTAGAYMTNPFTTHPTVQEIIQAGMQVTSTKADKARRRRRATRTASALDVARRCFDAAGSDDKTFVLHSGANPTVNPTANPGRIDEQSSVNVRVLLGSVCSIRTPSFGCPCRHRQPTAFGVFVLFWPRVYRVSPAVRWAQHPSGQP